MTTDITYVRVRKGLHAGSLKDGLIDAYQRVFAGPPYYEKFTDEQVIADVWDPHISDGILILALNHGVVIGFGCAVPLEKAPEDVRSFLRQAGDEFTADPATTWYMSDLGVREDYRYHGVGTELVARRLEAISEYDGTHYVMRTAAEGSNSLHLYRKIGSRLIKAVQELTPEQVGSYQTQSTRRIYLFGECAPVLQALRLRPAE